MMETKGTIGRRSAAATTDLAYTVRPAPSVYPLGPGVAIAEISGGSVLLAYSMQVIGARLTFQ